MLLAADMLDCFGIGTISTLHSGIPGLDASVTPDLAKVFNQAAPGLDVYGRWRADYTSDGAFDIAAGESSAKRLQLYSSDAFGPACWQTFRLTKVAEHPFSTHYLSFSFRTSNLAVPLVIAGIQDGCALSDYPANFATAKVAAVNADGSLSLAGTASAPGLIAVNTEYLIEMEADPALDVIRVWVNGALALTKSATGWFGLGVSKIGVVYSGRASPSTTSTYDHIFMLDYYDDGGPFCARPAKQLKSVALPIASAVEDDLPVFGGAANKKAALSTFSGVVYDSAQGAISGSAAVATDRFALDASGVAGKSILGVIVAPLAARTGIPVDHDLAVQASDGAHTQSQTMATPAPVRFRPPPQVPFLAAPDGAAWDATALAAATFGYRVTEKTT